MIKGFNSEKRIQKETENKLINLMDETYKYSYCNNLQESFKAIVKGMFGIIIIFIGRMIVLKGDISIGTLITFDALLIYFIGPIERLIDLQPEI